MAWIAVDEDGSEWVYECEPVRNKYDRGIWVCEDMIDNLVLIPKGTIKKLIGRDLTWDNEAVEIK